MEQQPLHIVTASPFFAVSRPINGIALNPHEYLLGDNDEVLLFTSRELAKAHLLSFGMTPEEIETLDISEYTPPEGAEYI